MSITVGIDGRTLGVRGGSRRYTRKLLDAFSSHKDIQPRILTPSKRIWNHLPEALTRLTWENTALPARIHFGDIDLFHGPKNVVPIGSTVPTVVTVHDLIPGNSTIDSSFKQRIYYLIWKNYVESADHVIAISKSTKSDILSDFSIEDEKVSVIYHGVDEIYKPLDASIVTEIRDSLGINPSNDVLLNVGTIKPNKNYLRLVETFEVIRERGFDCSLVIAGRPGRDSERIMQYIANSDWSDGIHVLGFVSDNQLHKLYNLADVFVHPSLYEGFGLPPLEAMACGTPVVASNASSVPEIVGDAGLLVNPYDTIEIADAVERVLTNKDTHKRLRRKGLLRAKAFTWENTAKETIEVYRSALEKCA